MINVFWLQRISIVFFIFLCVSCGGGSSKPLTGSSGSPADTTAPVITLNGNSNITLIQGEPYIEEGASALDDRDGSVNIDTDGSVNSDAPGVYTLRYIARDSAGNSTEAFRTVIVEQPADTTPPVIQLNGSSETTLILGNEYIEEQATATDDRDGDVAVTIYGAVNTSLPGVYTLSYSARDTAGNTSFVTRTVSVVLPTDSTAPIITLNGSANITLRQGDAYTDAGAGVSDNNAVTLTISGTVDTSRLGIYTLTYTATDAAGNSATALRTITVLAPLDTQAPIIELIGTPAVTLIQGRDYVESGAMARDERDGIIDVSISGTVDSAVPGTYLLVYSAVDAAGNRAETTRTVTVIPPDTNPPLVTLVGDNTVTLIQGDEYVEQGATVSDNRYDNLQVSISGTVNTELPGEYTLTYSALDDEGNEGQQTRTVVVLAPDTTPPVITLIGDSSATLIQGSEYLEQGATVSDDRYEDLQITISGGVNTNLPGTYILTYSARDGEGNYGETTRSVTVLVPDTTPPVITLNGDTTVTLTQGDDYIEQGATVQDDRYTNLQLNINGTVNIDVPGEYVITYSATDDEGNSAQETRSVLVVALAAFVTTWKTDNNGASADNEITISTFGDGYDYSVDWGDGSSDSNVTQDITHTYSEPGIYTVIITGTFPRIYFNGAYDNEKLLSVEKWGTNPWSSMAYAFYGCSNLVINASDAPNLSLVTDMKSMFEGASKMNQNIGHWDTSTVTDMSTVFSGASTFNQDISKWVTSEVEDMNGMFFSASAFNQDISEWDTQKVKYMNDMFADAEAFNQNIGVWDTAAVTGMSYMFNAASAFNQDISGWDTSKVTDMSGMFSFTGAFNQSIGTWDTSSVIDMSYMFDSSGAFNQNLSGWDISAVGDMTDMFKGITLSTENYDALLESWAAQPLQQDVVFNGGNSQYSEAAQTSRDTLSDAYNWTITDGGSTP